MMLSSVAGRMIVSCCLLERLILCQLLWPDQTVIRSTIVVCVCSCSDQLDAIAQKKLVNFVHDLMTQYFDFVCRRVQLEVLSPLHLCVCVFVLCLRHPTVLATALCFYAVTFVLFIRRDIVITISYEWLEQF